MQAGIRRGASGDDKAHILFESLQPGVNVSEGRGGMV